MSAVKFDPLTAIESVRADLAESMYTTSAKKLERSLAAITALVAAAREARTYIEETARYLDFPQAAREPMETLDAALSAFPEVAK